MSRGTMKYLIFFMLFIVLLGCEKTKQCENKYFSISVPKEYVSDSLDLGIYTRASFPKRRLIYQEDSNSYMYFFTDKEESFENSKGIALYNSIVENPLNKSLKQLLSDEINSSNTLLKEYGNQNYKVIIPVKECKINTYTAAYYAYQYDKINSSKVTSTVKKALLYCKKGNAIYQIDLKFDNSKNSNIQKKFDEMNSVLQSLVLKH